MKYCIIAFVFLFSLVGLAAGQSKARWGSADNWSKCRDIGLAMQSDAHEFALQNGINEQNFKIQDAWDEETRCDIFLKSKDPVWGFEKLVHRFEGLDYHQNCLQFIIEMESVPENIFISRREGGFTGKKCLVEVLAFAKR